MKKLQDMLRGALCILLFFPGLLAGCATLPCGGTATPESAADAFVSALKRSDWAAAAGMFTPGLAWSVTPLELERQVRALTRKWGEMGESETVSLLFHKRPGEAELIPAGTLEESVHRYVYEITLGRHEQIFCGVTVIKTPEAPRIAWFAFWGAGSGPEGAAQEAP